MALTEAGPRQRASELLAQTTLTQKLQMVDGAGVRLNVDPKDVEKTLQQVVGEM